MMYQTTQAHEELRAKVREFAEAEIKPIAFMLDKNNQFQIGRASCRERV